MEYNIKVYLLEMVPDQNVMRPNNNSMMVYHSDMGLREVLRNENNSCGVLFMTDSCVPCCHGKTVMRMSHCFPFNDLTGLVSWQMLAAATAVQRVINIFIIHI
ncbi:hypothetical protein ACH5RR_017374 [Cinchona calisaya]|uniref:Uncharacterized protein n=1 Tax=Cinchona calisaya TaxID=153742 RepID=A0ABD2ZYJ9_9GENT